MEGSSQRSVAALRSAVEAARGRVLVVVANDPAGTSIRLGGALTGQQARRSHILAVLVSPC